MAHEESDREPDMRWPSMESEEAIGVSEIFIAGSSDNHVSPSRSRHNDRAATRVTARRRRRRSIIAVVVALGLVGAAVYVVLGFLGPLFRGDSGAQPLADFPGPGRGSVQVTVSPGDTGTAIGATLTDAGVVSTQKAFTTAYTANPDAASIQPGTYDLLLEMRGIDAVAALLDPARRVSYQVTVPEGLTAAQTFERVSSITTIPAADLAAAAADPAIGLPPEAGGNVEGWLFPATYSVEPDGTATSILAQMVAKTLSVLDAAGVPADQRERVLILASVAEKEVSAPEEYSKVARVIENRLARQIPLGMDTINAYGLGKAAIDLTAEDLAADNPYNSRQRLGLPPTPISNPGEATILAAVSPAEGDWTFFITVNLDTGETLFTNDYDEFLAGKAQYQEWLAANG